MAVYDVVARCAHCGAEHPILMKIFLSNGPTRRQSVAEVFRGQPLPPQVSALKRHSALCLKSGKKYQLTEEQSIILTPA
jgi:hypothetical protein